jgi:F-type H+-transporting ATPase subunit beta
MTDYGVRSVFPYLDTFVILSREVYQDGLLPAVDLLKSTSTALNPAMVGEDHYRAYVDATELLEQSESLEKIVSLVGFSELSVDDQVIYRRSILLRNYMTQNFFATKQQTGKEGDYVPREKTVGDVIAILNGKYDDVESDKLRYLGSLEGVKLPKLPKQG